MGNSEIGQKELRILFILQEDPFYIKTFFSDFLQGFTSKDEIVGTVICSTMGKASLLKQARQMYNFYGSVDFLRMAWRYAMVKLKKDTLEKLFNAYKIKVYKNDDINGESFLSFWEKQDLDIIVSVAAPKIFKERLLKLPKWGCLNMHSARLPYYRGMMPVFWQMYHNEKTVGLTVHRMDAKLDEGEVILQEETAIDPTESLDALIIRTKKMMAQNLIAVLQKVRNGEITYLPKSQEAGSYFTFPTKTEVREFRRKGKRIL